MGGFDSFMTKAGRLGNKVADTAVNGLKWGQKAAGNVVKYGTKGLDIAKHRLGIQGQRVDTTAVSCDNSK